MIRIIINRIKIYISHESPKLLLGRWNIESCNNKINDKVDLANEDHCGPCGQYVSKKLNDTDIINSDIEKLKK